nr:reverse transcriptase domain-containing protein [Tanacetum cinerariifolium]
MAVLDADHLSRLEKPNLKELREEEINDQFPHEFLMSISTDEKESLWFADFANYLVGGILRKGLTYAQRSNYRETMPWASEKPYIYTVVENTCNEAKLYDLNETGKGIVIENILYVPSEGISLGKK